MLNSSHPFLVHLPIGAVFLCWILEVLALWGSSRIGLRLFCAAIGASSLLIITTIVHPSLTTFPDAQAEVTFTHHSDWALYTSLLMVVYVLVLAAEYRQTSSPPAPGRRWLNVAASSAVTAALGVLVYYGLALVYQHGITG